MESRYKRQIQLSEIGVKGQEKLKRSKVLIVGAGGLGCPVLQYLASSGVGVLGICDSDLIEESNLARQILYSKSECSFLIFCCSNAANLCSLISRIAFACISDKL